MAWQRVAPHLLKQDAPHERLEWYWDDGPLTTGELLLWLDRWDRVLRFQLTHVPFPGHREYLADWRPESGLRLGQLGYGEGTPHHKMAPIIRYQRPDARRLAQLAAYFASNAWVLDPRHRAAIAVALGAPAPPEFTAAQAPPVRGARHAVSGKNGGRGAGAAATRKRQTW